MNGQTLQKLIQEIVDHTIIEMAKQPDEAVSKGFALSVSRSGGSIYLVLYQPGTLEEICAEIAKQPTHLSVDARMEAALYMINNPMVGFIRMKTDDCGWIIQNSVAHKGYGPMMYDIAFSYAGKKGLIPDRECISDSARKIWKYYITNRKHEFRIYPLATDDECSTWGAQGDRDSWFLDVRYIMRQTDNGKVSALIAKGDEILNKLEQTYQGTLPVEEIMRRLASAFFDYNFH